MAILLRPRVALRKLDFPRRPLQSASREVFRAVKRRRGSMAAADQLGE